MILNDFEIQLCLSQTTICEFLWFTVYLKHCVKSVQVRRFFWSVFSCIRTRKTPYLDTSHAAKAFGKTQIILINLSKSFYGSDFCLKYDCVTSI